MRRNYFESSRPNFDHSQIIGFVLFSIQLSNYPNAPHILPARKSLDYIHRFKVDLSAPESKYKEEDDAIRHLFQRLGVLLVKGNAALLLNRIPSFPLPELDGDM